MSQYLRRVAPVLTAALVVAGAPLLAPAPATAIPSVPSLGCVTNLPVTSQNLTDVPIPDNNVVLLLNKATSVINVPADGSLSWLRVRTDVLHTNPGDLLMTLTSPQGDVVTLTDGFGGASDYVVNGTWWDDDAGESIATPGSVTEAVFANNVVQPLLAPETALSSLRGHDVQGNWVLTVGDRLIGNSGTITGWAIEYATRGADGPNVRTVSSGPIGGGTVAPGSQQSFTYAAPVSGPGALQDVVANLDVAGQAGSVLATLTSPAGTVITLTNGNGGLNSLLGGTTFSDLGGLGLGPITSLLTSLAGRIPLSGPQEPLGALTGEGLAGVWTLNVTNLGGLPITLNDWGLDLTGSTCGLDGVVTSLTQLPTTLPLGSTVAYAVSVTNNRLAPLDLSTLNLALPNGLDLVSVTSTLGSCAGLTCVLGTLLPGAQAVVVYLLKAVTDGVKNVSVLLTSGGTDAVPLNNVLNIATTVPAGSGPGTSGNDTTAPGLVLVLGKDNLKTVTTKGLLSAAGWTEAGKLVLTVKLPGKVAKKLKLPRVIGKRTIVTSKAGTAKVRVKISKKAAKKLLKAHKQVRLVVKGQIRDAAGNLGKASAGGTYKP
jgi:subtilisin-like proprotein convertase family protein